MKIQQTSTLIQSSKVLEAFMSGERISLADTKGLWSMVVYSHMCKVLQSLYSLVHVHLTSSQSGLQFFNHTMKG